MDKMLQPIRINGIEIRNRITVPPMVCFKYADERGLVSEKHMRHYEALARGGAGLIIVEATCIMENGRLSMDQLGLWSEEQIPGMKRLAEVCHENGAKVLVQLHHAGEKRSASLNIEGGAFHVDELKAEEIEALKAAYIQGAVRAMKAGFDGVELHGAHGYLLNQFASPLKNHREDGFGGRLENRMRFAAEVIRGIREACPELGILGYRMGGNEPGLEDGIHIGEALEKLGVDLLHVSAGIEGPELPEAPKDAPYSWIVHMGTEIKRKVGIPVIVVNGIRDRNVVEQLVAGGLADLVALGRPHLVDPDWTKKTAAGEEPISCLNCKPCRWFKDGSNCPRKRA